MSRPFGDVMSAIFLPMLPALTAFLVSFAGAWLLGYEQPGQATVREIRGGRLTRSLLALAGGVGTGECRRTTFAYRGSP